MIFSFSRPRRSVDEEREESCSCQEILEFRRWCRHAVARDLAPPMPESVTRYPWDFMYAAFCLKSSEVPTVGKGVAAKRSLSNSAQKGIVAT